MKDRIKNFIVKTIEFVLNPHLLICLGLGWIITNGWAYVFIFCGTVFKIPWMFAIGTSYLAFLWIPVANEGIVTLFISIFLLKKLFPHDEKTLGQLESSFQAIKNAIVQKKKDKEHAEAK